MFNSLKIIIILCLISSLARFVLDSYLPSMPGIAHDLSITDASTQLTLTLYLLGFSLSQLIYGPLSDHYGRRRIILIGLSVFFVGNLACALAAKPALLILARFVAGVGAGSCGVLNRAIASDCFKGAEFSKVWSYTTTTLVLTLCIAPVMGGYIQELWGWRANFMLSTVFVGCVLGLILKFLPETHLKNIPMKTGISQLSVSAVMQNYKTILATPPFLASALCYTLAFSGLIAYFQVSPLLFIDDLGLSPSQYGWTSLVIASNYLIGGLIVSKLAARWGTQCLLIVGALLLIVGGSLLWLVARMDTLSLTSILLPTAIYVIGARIVIPNAIASSMENLRHLNGSSSALIGFIQMLGSSLISFCLTSFDNASALPLAIFLTILGCLTLGFSLLMIKNRILIDLSDAHGIARWLAVDSTSTNPL
jgi:Bcr/CflA subfamily drug resistance transporter